MNLNHFYHYYKSKSGGVSNLLLGSEELNQSDQGEWVRYNMNAVNANVPGVANPLSSDETVEQLDFEASTVARIAQTVTLTAGTEYTFSVWARAASGTQPFRLRYWDSVGGSGGGSAFTASATWSASTGRYEMTFTAQNSGTFQMFIQNAGGTAVSRRIYFWGAMLNVGASALDYVKTEFPAGPSNPPTAPMEFGDNFANVTAYYSLRRFTKGEDNNAIRVRRSSDDTEQDIGFDANGDLDSTALTTFVNEDYNAYTSDFSSGTDSFTEHSTTNAGNIDAVSDGTTSKDDVLRVTMTGGSTSHQIRKANIFDGANTYNVSFEYYIPSSNTKLDEIVFRTNVGGDGDTAFSNVGTWSTGSISDFTPSGTQVRFNATDGGAFIFDADGDVFYLKNIVVTQTTADGHITTWYDQTGNGNHATNATDTEQPLVVSGGSVTQLNSRAAINGDGANDVLSLGTGLDLSSGYSIFQVVQVPSANTYGITISSSDVSNFSRTMMFDGLYRFSADATNYDNYGSSGNRGAQYLWSSVVDGSGNLDTNRNGSAYGSQITGVTGTFELDIIGTNLTVNSFEYFQELIVFNSDQSSNRTGMETNINDHFTIYP